MSRSPLTSGGKKLEKEIARPEKQARTEKQPKKKFELVQKLNEIKKEISH
ncbi:MAG: hypothetical protein ACI4KD_03955 [Oscillospiraceae bacterium]